MSWNSTTRETDADNKPGLWISARVVTRRIPEGLQVIHKVLPNTQTMKFVFNPGAARSFRNGMIERGLGTETTPLGKLCQVMFKDVAGGRFK